MLELSSISRFKFFNLDRVQEILETNNKAIVLVCGASSSGKSYVANLIEQTLKDANLKTITISTDNYNKGISGIICDKVNKNYFNSQIKDIVKIKQIVKNCIINNDFNEKFNKNTLILIKEQLSNILSSSQLNIFIPALKTEFDKINFDEPSVYDLKTLSNDVNNLVNNNIITEKKYSKVISEQMENSNTIDGKNLDVILIEGIYAFEDDIVKNIPKDLTVLNFVEGNSKSLFLRRVIRDAKTTSANNLFTIKLYFKFIVPSYINQILPKKHIADFVYKNDMTFTEMHSGNVYTTKDKVFVKDKSILNLLLKYSKIISKEKHKDFYFCGENENVTEQNLLRYRTIFDEEKQQFVPTSLIHKGAIKNRKDKKIKRPINILIKEGDFFKIFKSEEDFLNNMKMAQFNIERIVLKTRTRIKLLNQEFTIDDIINEGIFVEFANTENIELIDKVKIYAKTEFNKTKQFEFENYLKTLK